MMLRLFHRDIVKLIDAEIHIHRTQQLNSQYIRVVKYDDNTNSVFVRFVKGRWEKYNWRIISVPPLDKEFCFNKEGNPKSYLPKRYVYTYIKPC